MKPHARDNLITAILLTMLAIAGVVFVLAVGGCEAGEYDNLEVRDADGNRYLLTDTGAATETYRVRRISERKAVEP